MSKIQTIEQVNQNIDFLQSVFGRSGSKVVLFNDMPNYCIYAVNTYFSVGKTTMKKLREQKGKIIFIDFDNEGLRLLVQIPNKEVEN